MTLVDRWGVAIQHASYSTVEAFDRAVEDFALMRNDPLSTLDEAIAAVPEVPLLMTFRAYFDLYSQTSEGLAAAAQRIDAVEGKSEHLGRRERLHLSAARSWLEGRLDDATSALEDALVDNPHDVLALKVAQDLYFFLGDSSNLRDVAARVAHAWGPGDHSFGVVQGIYAFGLEETADYRGAESLARLALAMEPLDTWANHALAHVLEMEGRTIEGARFLTTSSPEWSVSYFAVHTWWHLALYHLELGNLDAALELYDGPVRRGDSSAWLDLVDAGSLLWRLSLLGVDVSARAAALVSALEERIDEAIYVFNDLHAAMIFGLAGRHDLNETLLSALNKSLGTNAWVVGTAGRRLVEGFAAFSAGSPSEAVSALRAVRSRAFVIGGSHAQRDVIDQTLLAGASRSGQGELVQALISERLERKPSSADAAHRLTIANQPAR